jgi:ankyrin repeat protein
LLVDRGADINAKSEYDETALTLAAWGGSKDVTQLLLDQGADIEATEKDDGYTALHGAVDLGHEEVARLLLEHGSNVARNDKRGRTPLQIARANDNLALESLLLQFDAINSPARVVGVRELWRVIKKRVNEKRIPQEVLPPALQPAQAPAPAEPEH